MGIMNRKQKDKVVDDGGDPPQKEKVKFSKRPASKPLQLQCCSFLISHLQTLLSSSKGLKLGSQS